MWFCIASATAEGGCSTPVITYVDEVIPGNCDGNYTVVRSWTASDNCGNEVTKDQIIVFQDTTAPELTVPDDFTAECSDDIVLEDASATDVCSSFTIEVTSVTTAETPLATTSSFAPSPQLTTAETASATQTITVQDTTAPESHSCLQTTP